MREPDRANHIDPPETVRAEPTPPGATVREYTDQIAAKIAASFARLTEKINGLLSFGTGTSYEWSGNIDAQTIRWRFPSTPDQETAIPHELGRVPWGFILCGQDRAGSIYYTNIGGWNAKTIYLKCSVADLFAQFLLF